MQMLYNSDSFAVMKFDVPGHVNAGVDAVVDAGTETGTATGIAAAAPGARQAYEIVDKFARKGIFLEGAVAESFRHGVQALVESGPSEEQLDDFIAGFTALAQQPVVLH